MIFSRIGQVAVHSSSLVISPVPEMGLCWVQLIWMTLLTGTVTQCQIGRRTSDSALKAKGRDAEKLPKYG